MDQRLAVILARAGQISQLAQQHTPQSITSFSGSGGRLDGSPSVVAAQRRAAEWENTMATQMPQRIASQSPRSTSSPLRPSQPMSPDEDDNVRPPMETGVMDVLAGHDEREDLAISILKHLERIGNCIQIVTSYAARLQEHSFTELYSRQLEGYIMEHTVTASSAEGSLRRAIADDSPLFIVYDINVYANTAANRAELQWAELKEKVEGFFDTINTVDTNNADSDGDDLDDLEENLFKKRTRLTSKQDGPTAKSKGYKEAEPPKRKRGKRSQATSSSPSRSAFISMPSTSTASTPIIAID